MELGYMDYYLIDSNVIASFDAPHLIPGVTIAGHILTGKPLTAATAKKVLAKELQLWGGVDGYYSSRSTKYIGLTGNVIGANYKGTYGMLNDVTATTICLLVALAQMTGRVLILPRIISKTNALRHV
jgi:hypothetical protein